MSEPIYYLNADDDAAQDGAIPYFRGYVRTEIGTSATALEIGPSYNPILPKKDGYNVTVLDHDDEAGLIEKYSNLPLVSNIEPVDLVWQDGPLSLVLRNRHFAAIVASHVIEHSPDFIQFLNDCTAALGNNGRLYLIVPDKRYCFDYLQPITDPAKVLSDHLQRLTRHPFLSFYRWSSNVTADGRGDWSQHQVCEIAFMHPDPRQNYRNALACAASDQYVDSHENYFTPISFMLLIEELHYLNCLDLSIDVLTRSRGCEFLAVLSKSKQRKTLEEFIHVKRKLHALRMSEELEAINVAEWRLTI
jgi:2-polyprenyl-3-methyl-5-hydroxy-6-metoxy-1,4-benzoquinol methylase